MGGQLLGKLTPLPPFPFPLLLEQSADVLRRGHTHADARRGAGETMYNGERILENGEWIVHAGECIVRNVDRRSTYWIIIMEEAYYCREGRMGNV